MLRSDSLGIFVSREDCTHLTPVVLDFGTSFVVDGSPCTGKKEEGKSTTDAAEGAESGDGGDMCAKLGRKKIQRLPGATESYLPIWYPKGKEHQMSIIYDACCPLESTDLFAFGAFLYRFCLEVDKVKEGPSCCDTMLDDPATPSINDACNEWLPGSYKTIVQTILGSSKCQWMPRTNQGAGGFHCSNLAALDGVTDAGVEQLFDEEERTAKPMLPPQPGRLSTIVPS